MSKQPQPQERNTLPNNRMNKQPLPQERDTLLGNSDTMQLRSQERNSEYKQPKPQERADQSDNTVAHMHFDADAHASIKHEDAAIHHHHSHASTSVHEAGHHLLQVEHLTIGFNRYEAHAGLRAKKQRHDVVHNMNLSVHTGEILAVVGASGAGKTLLADTLMGLFEPNSFVEGIIWFDGVLQDASSLRELRGKGISLVPQSVNALDPLMKVGKQVAERASSKRTKGAEKRERRQRQRELFRHYGLGEEVEQLYPFELSGGMARRVLLCTALMEEPKLIIADEPTPGLDLGLAIKAIEDFREFANQGGGVLLITHDIELALRVADRVAVFQDGTVVEETAVANFASPDTLRHPFSKALWHALPEHTFTPLGNEGDAVVSDDCYLSCEEAPPLHTAQDDRGSTRTESDHISSTEEEDELC